MRHELGGEPWYALEKMEEDPSKHWVLRVIQQQILKQEDRQNPKLWRRKKDKTNGKKRKKETIYCLKMMLDFMFLTVIDSWT